jgi:hypothetical protein
MSGKSFIKYFEKTKHRNEAPILNSGDVVMCCLVRATAQFKVIIEQWWGGDCQGKIEGTRRITNYVTTSSITNFTIWGD